MSRYVVRELEGFRITAGQEATQSPGLSVYVLDSAREWSVVRTWRSEEVGDRRGGREGMRSHCRREARALADQLNEEEATP